MSPSSPVRGILPPIPTPFRPDGSMALDALRANLKRWNELPLSGYVVGGSNAEFVLMSDEERIEAVRAARSAVPEDRWLIAGAGAQSTARTIDLGQAMLEAGADALIVVTPSYYRRQMSVQAYVEHYRTVAEAVARPLFLYSVPGNTAIDLPFEAVLELAQHPHVAGLKDSGGDVARLGAIRAGTPDEFILLAGSADFLLPALAVGAVGAVSALANIAGDRLVELQSRFEAGDLEGARRIQLAMIEPNRAVTARYGVPGLKAALDLLGYYGGPVRGPLLPLTEAEKGELRSILAAANLLPE